MKKVCFIAQFPPPIHGLSKAVETLYNSELTKEFEFEKIDITNNQKILKNLSLIKRSNADLFYFTISQTWGGNLRDLAILRAVGNRPCVVHLHGGYYRKLVDQLPNWQKIANYKAIGKLAGAIVLGASFRYIFEGILPDDKIYTIPNCVDDEYLMSDEEFEEKIATISKRTVIHVLYLSNMIRSKGYPEVLEIAKLEKVHAETTGERRFHFDFAGKFLNKSEENFFINYVKENELSEFVTYHGVVDGDKKRQLFKICDIFILLTHYPKEGQPISILEAMGNGMLIVTTYHVGIPELISNGLSGLTYSKIDSVIIYSELKIINNKLLTCAQKNRNVIVSGYMQSKYLQNFRNLLNNL